MNMRDTDTCGVQEICGLSSYASAKEAMSAFCRWNLRKKPKYRGADWDNPGQLYCFYLFTAALTPYDKRYGNEFAAYILKHKLGDVAEAPPMQNSAFHPDHKNQAWLWAPDVKALEKWWDEQKAKQVK